MIGVKVVMRRETETPERWTVIIRVELPSDKEEDFSVRVRNVSLDDAFSWLKEMLERVRPMTMDVADESAPSPPVAESPPRTAVSCPVGKKKKKPVGIKRWLDDIFPIWRRGDTYSTTEMITAYACDSGNREALTKRCYRGLLHRQLNLLVEQGRLKKVGEGRWKKLR